jgi:hypothetical protein
MAESHQTYVGMSNDLQYTVGILNMDIPWIHKWQHAYHTLWNFVLGVMWRSSAKSDNPHENPSIRGLVCTEWIIML